MKSLRIVTLNLWNGQRGVERRMEVMVPQLLALHPHVVTLQEVLESPRGLQQGRLIAEALRAEYRFGCVDAESAGGPIGTFDAIDMNGVAGGWALDKSMPGASLTLPALWPCERGISNSGMMCAYRAGT